jgi:hypothetical protein
MYHSKIKTTSTEMAGLEVNGWKQLMEKSQYRKTNNEVKQEPQIRKEMKIKYMLNEINQNHPTFTNVIKWRLESNPKI